MSKKKKIAIISTMVIAAFIVIGIVYALLSDRQTLYNTTVIGSLNIENTAISVKKPNNEDALIWEPADVNTVSWTTENTGTIAALTRHTLEIYWKDDTDASASDLLYLYPANVTKEAILEDFKNEKALPLETEKVSKEVNGKTKYGIRYQFIGDILDATDMVVEIPAEKQDDIIKEVNYNKQVDSNNDSNNNSNNEATNSIIDEDINTDDANTLLDSIAFKLLVSPQTSYLFQGRELSIKVTTEAMQYTEDGSETWTVVSTQQTP